MNSVFLAVGQFGRDHAIEFAFVVYILRCTALFVESFGQWVNDKEKGITIAATYTALGKVFKAVVEFLLVFGFAAMIYAAP